jgi:two-component system sensor histidine kinase YesM
MSKLRKLFLYDMLSIKRKIFIVIILITLLPLLISVVYFYESFSSVLNKVANDALLKAVQDANRNIEASFDSIDTTTSQLVSNPIVLKNTMNSYAFPNFYSPALSPDDLQSSFKYTLLINPAWDHGLINSIYLFDNSVLYYSVSRSKKNIQSVNSDNINIYNRYSYYNGKDKILIPPQNNDNSIYCFRNIFDINNNKVYYRLILAIDENILSQDYNSILIYPETKAFIYDENGVIFSALDKKLLGKPMDAQFLNLVKTAKMNVTYYDKQKYFIASKKIDNTNLTLTILVPQNQILLNLSKSINNFLIIVLFIFGLSILASIFIYKKFIKIVSDFLNAVKLVNQGDYTAKLPIYEDHELNQVSITFNTMTSEIQYLINQVYEKQLLLKSTELKFLQSQMNPHFLFNVLATISWKSRMSGDESIYKMITSLSELLQASIYSDSKTEIPISKELQYVEFYLYLQKTRFEDRLTYTINISDDLLLDCYLPKLSLEPIVENAVVHGLENKIGSGNVTINIKSVQESIYFEVIDDGVGFDSKNILQNNTEPPSASRNHNSIGLSNTDKRLKLLYGEQYGISIKSEKDVGTTVTVHIPIDRGGLTNV